MLVYPFMMRRSLYEKIHKWKVTIKIFAQEHVWIANTHETVVNSFQNRWKLPSLGGSVVVF